MPVRMKTNEISVMQMSNGFIYSIRMNR